MANIPVRERTFKSQVIALDTIKFDKKYRARAAISDKAIAEYQQLWSDADDDTPYPFAEPIVLFWDGEHHWPGAGTHRCMAAIKAGMTDVPAKVADGTCFDALEYSCGENVAHGVPRTREDKRRAVTTILTMHPKMKHVRVARYCGVVRQFVAQVKSELEHAAAKESGELDEPIAGNLDNPQITQCDENVNNNIFPDDEPAEQSAAEPHSVEQPDAQQATQLVTETSDTPPRLRGPRVNAKLEKIDQRTDEAFGVLIRLTDARLEERNVKGSAQYHEACIGKLREFRNLLKSWREKA